MAFGLTLSGVPSAVENRSGLAKPETEKCATSAVFAGGLLAEEKNWPSVFPTSANFVI